MAEIKFTVGREYLNDLAYSDTDYTFMEKDRRTHSSDWLDTSAKLNGYKKYGDREPYQLVRLSKGLEAKVNDAFRIPLRHYITDVCSMTSDRPFYDAYVDVKIYRDPVQSDCVNIFCWIILSCGDDVPDTLSRSLITGLFEKDHYDETVKSYSLENNFNDFENTFIYRAFEDYGAYTILYEALDLEIGEMFYRRTIVDVEGISAKHFNALYIDSEPLNSSEPMTSPVSEPELNFQCIGPFDTPEELYQLSTYESIESALIQMIPLYRKAFGLQPLQAEILKGDVIVELFGNDCGRDTIFKRHLLHLFTNTLGGTSVFETIESFAEEIINNLGFIHDFENLFEEEDFDPSLTIALPSRVIQNNLAFCTQFFTSDFRHNKATFLNQLEEYQRQESLSPWFVIAQNLRNDRDVVLQLLQDQLLFKDFENLLPVYANDSSLFSD